MKIVRLHSGERPPAQSDAVMVQRARDGRYAVLGQLNRGEGELHWIGETFASPGEAEAAGIRWAQQQPISTLHVSHP